MSFSSDLSTNVGLVRAELGDDTEGEGVKPDGANLSDEYITVLLSREGSVGAATAAACETLARAWASTSSSLSANGRSESFNQSKQWADRAASLRMQYGGGGSGAFSVQTVRGWSGASEYTRDDGG